MLISKNPKVKGKILFHAKLINKSYRNRGSVARAQIQKNTKKTVKKIAKKLVGLGLKITVDLNILKKKNSSIFCDKNHSKPARSILNIKSRDKF